MPTYFDARHQPIRLEGDALGRGGEGGVFRIAGRPGEVAKIYHHPPDREKSIQLQWMVDHPPEQPKFSNTQHRSIAWPTELLYANSSQAVGFVMPLIQDGVSILKIFNPSFRKRLIPDFNWIYLHRTARNLSLAVWAIHQKDYVIGDLNDKNILVRNDTLVTIIDADSFQVTTKNPDHVFCCPGWRQEYTPVELIGKDLKTTVRSAASDNFGLAVLIYQLLMDGRHPFQGIFTGAGDPPLPLEAISKGWFVYSSSPSKPINPPPRPPYSALYPKLQELFSLCFTDGFTDPSKRPSAEIWSNTLAEAERSISKCGVDAAHFYYSGLSKCPRCTVLPPPPPPQSPGVPILSIRKTPLLFNDIIQGSSPQRKNFYVSNTGTRTLNVTIAAPPSLGWLSVHPLSLSVLPNAKIKVAVRIYPQKLSGGPQGSSYSTQIDIHSDGGNQVLKIQATVYKPEIKINPGILDFGLLQPGETVQRKLNLSSLGPQTFQADIIPPSGITVNPPTVLCAPGTSPSTVVSLTAPQAGGVWANNQYSGQIEIQSIAGRQLVPFKAAVAVPKISVTPQNFSIGPIAPNDVPARNSIVIKNSGTGLLQAELSLEPSEPWLSLSTNKFGLTAGSTKTIDLVVNSFPAAIVKSFVGKICVRSNAGDITIPVNITIGQAVLQMVPDGCLDFGVVTKGETRQKTVAFTNTGNVPLRVAISTIPGWVKVSTQSFDCRPGEKKEVIFTAETDGIDLPSLSATLTGDLEVQSTGGQFSPQCQIIINAPRLRVESSELNFGNIQQGEEKSIDLVVSNEGKAPLKGKITNNSSWVKIVPLEINLQPGESKPVRISVEAKNITGSEMGNDYLSCIVINSNGGNLSIPWKVKMCVPVLKLDSLKLDFGKITDSPKPQENLVIHNAGLVALKGKISCEPAYLEPSEHAFDCPPNASISIPVFLLAERIVFNETRKIKLWINVSAQNVSSQKVIVTAEINPPLLQVSFDQLQFRKIANGPRYGGKFQIRNTGKSSLNISIEVSNPLVEVTPLTQIVRQGSAEDFWIMMKIEDPAEASSDVIIKSNGGTEKLCIKVQGSPPALKVIRQEKRVFLNEACEIDFIRIPAGRALVGSDPSLDAMAERRVEVPQQQYDVGEYWISKGPVSNQQYKVFLDVTGTKIPEAWPDANILSKKADHPVVMVNYADCLAFCKWLSKETGLKIRLPNEIEWEKAARSDDGRIWPWGNDPPTHARCNFASNDTTPIGLYSPDSDSRYGCVDMSGNVSEWTKSLYKPYPYDATDGREESQPSSLRVIRGGSWYYGIEYTRCAARLRDRDNNRRYYTGFRCVFADF